MNLNTIEKQTLLTFLEDLLNRFHNDGCNDHELPLNEEGIEFCRNALKFSSGMTDEELNEQFKYGNKIITSNIALLTYLIHKLNEPKPKFVYQLQAGGVSSLDQRYERRSSTVFLTEEAAQQRIPQMIDMCCDPQFLVHLERESATVQIVPLEIVE